MNIRNGTPWTRRQFLGRSAGLLAATGVLAVLSDAPGVFAAAASGVVPTRARGSARVEVSPRAAQGGAQDDTAAIQAAIDSLPASGGTVHLRAGTYRIDPIQSLRLRSRMHLELDPDARLVAIPNAEKRGYVLYAFKVEDVEMSGGQIIGDRQGHLGTEGEWGHGIQIRGASRVTVRDMRIADCWGDGVCIGGADLHQSTPSDDIVIARIVATGNRRQGLSIGRSQHVRVYDSEFSNTAGTNPQYGIDIEPDRPGGASDILIDHCVIKGNRGGGIQIFRRVSGVTIQRCTIEDNHGRGVLAVGAQDGVIADNTIRNNGLVGVAIRQQSSRFQVRGNLFAGNGNRPGNGNGRGNGRGGNGRGRALGNLAPDADVRVGEDTSAITVNDNRHGG